MQPFGGDPNHNALARRTAVVYFFFSDHLGSSRVIVQAGQTTPCYEADYYPFGGERVITNICSQNYKFTGKKRDGESGLDNFGARYLGSTLGRFMSADPLGGHREDPQTLNRYTYVRNNPLRFTDPTGLDFYLQCTETKDNKSTCQGGHVGTTDENGKFTATVVTSASLQDKDSGNTATVNENGVLITTKQGTFQGIFINETPAADIQGSGKLQDFSFHIDSSEEKKGTLDAGIYTYEGSRNQADVVRLLTDRGAFRYTAEKVFGNPFHKGDLNFRFSSGAHPNLFDYGPSPHLLVPQDPKARVPAGRGYRGSFHVDSHTGSGRHGACAIAGVGCQ